MTQETFRQEVTRLRPNLLIIARRYMDAEDAEDTVQDVMLRLWMMREELHLPINSLAAVLTKNLCINKLRSRRVFCEIDQVGEISDVQVPDERYERVLKVISTLPDYQQLVLQLRHMDGMEMTQIAELVGASEQAVRKTLSRARQAVRTKYLRAYEE